MFLGYLSDKVAEITKLLYGTDAGLLSSAVILFGGLIITDAAIYTKTRKYFLCKCQCLTASAGTCVLVTILYAVTWSLIQMRKGYQAFVVFQPQFWSLQVTLNNMKYATILCFFSSLSVASIFVFAPEPGYDFAAFRKHWLVWRRLIDKLGNNAGLKDPEEYAELVKAQEGMLTELSTIAAIPHVQPGSRPATS